MKTALKSSLKRWQSGFESGYRVCSKIAPLTDGLEQKRKNRLFSIVFH